MGGDPGRCHSGLKNQDLGRSNPERPGIETIGEIPRASNLSDLGYFDREKPARAFGASGSRAAQNRIRLSKARDLALAIRKAHPDDARSVMTAALIDLMAATITAASPTNVNPFSGRLEVIAEPGLTNTTAWYVVGDPAQVDGLVMAYLSGQQGPRVDSQAGWGTLGMEFRLVWSIGAAFHAFQGWYRNPGA